MNVELAKNETAQHDLITQYHEQAKEFENAKRYAEARDMYQKEIAVRERLIHQAPTQQQAELIYSQAHCHFEIAWLLSNHENQLQRGHQFFHLAYQEFLQALQLKEPPVPLDWRFDPASVLQHNAEVLIEQKKYRAAKKILDQSNEHLKPLREQLKGDAKLKVLTQLALNTFSMAKIHQHKKQNKDAIALTKEAIELLEQVIKEQPPQDHHLYNLLGEFYSELTDLTQEDEAQLFQLLPKAVDNLKKTISMQGFENASIQTVHNLLVNQCQYGSTLLTHGRYNDAIIVLIEDFNHFVRFVSEKAKAYKFQEFHQRLEQIAEAYLVLDPLRGEITKTLRSFITSPNAHHQKLTRLCEQVLYPNNRVANQNLIRYLAHLMHNILQLHQISPILKADYALTLWQHLMAKFKSCLDTNLEAMITSNQALILSMGQHIHQLEQRVTEQASLIQQLASQNRLLINQLNPPATINLDPTHEDDSLDNANTTSP